jgi:quercetin dioxygenase-like cupin family protein
VPGIPYRYRLLHNARQSKTQTLELDIEAATVAEAGGLAGHQGEELCYVLEGRLIIHFEDDEQYELTVGDSVLFNSRRPHAYTAPKGTFTRALIVVNPLDEPPAR